MASTSGPGSKIDRSNSVTPPTPPTVIECFQKKLPELKRGNEKHHSVGASGTTTKQAVVPKVLWCGSQIPLEEAADRALNNERVLTDRSGKPRITTNRHIASDLKSMALESEEDVVFAFNLYIMEPITEILKVLYPETMWTFSSECTDARLMKVSPTQAFEDENKATQKKKRKTTDGMASGSKGDDKHNDATKEDSTGNLRYDMIFHELLASGEKGRTIAVIEFKKPNQVRYRDFAGALLSIKEKETPSGKAEAQKLKDNTKKLRGNADSYTKQVCKYASQRGCHHAALFNWGHLLMYDFFQLGKPGLEGTAGDEADLIWVHEGAMTEEYDRSGLIRKAMLGWLLNAFKDLFG